MCDETTDQSTTIPCLDGFEAHLLAVEDENGKALLVELTRDKLTQTVVTINKEGVCRVACVSEEFGFPLTDDLQLLDTTGKGAEGVQAGKELLAELSDELYGEDDV